MEHIVNSLANEARETQVYIEQVDAVREVCVRAGEFKEAQACLDRIREVNLRFAQLVQSQAARYNDEEKTRLKELHKLEALESKKSWKERIRAYDQDAAQLLIQLERQQLLELQRTDAAFCRAEATADQPVLQSDETLALTEAVQRTGDDDDDETGTIRSRFQMSKQNHRASHGVVVTAKKNVAELRDALDRLVRAQRYLEADKVKKELARAEKQLEQCRHRELEHQRQQRLSETARRLREQHEAAMARITRGRQNLLRERDQSTQALTDSHQRAQAHLDASISLARNITASVLQEQLASYTADPARGNNFFIPALMKLSRQRRVRASVDLSASLQDDGTLEQSRDPRSLSVRRPLLAREK